MKPVASNTSNDRQMAEKIAIHSCTVSHTACHLNCLIEPFIRTHFAYAAIAQPLRGAAATVWTGTMIRRTILRKNHER